MKIDDEIAATIILEDFVKKYIVGKKEPPQEEKKWVNKKSEPTVSKIILDIINDKDIKLLENERRP